MSESAQPVAGSLSARIIRACPVHSNCELECASRRVEELGEIAAFTQEGNRLEFPGRKLP